MSIRPPSDIVLDVAQAADPLRYQEAAAKLGRTGAAGAAAQVAAGEAFDEVLGGIAELPSAPAMPFDPFRFRTEMRSNASLTTKHDGAVEKAAEPYRKFEAMALSGMVESMLPSDADAVFGTGTAGKIWKSMLAQQMAAEIAAGGGIGIASMVAGRSGVAGSVPDAARFDMSSVRSAAALFGAGGSMMDADDDAES